VATGLAVTGVGGDVLFIEATSMTADGTEPGLTPLTGQLGDVMKESAQIALSYVRSTPPSSASTRPRFDRSTVPRARARRRGAQGRPVRRRHDDHRAVSACSPAARCATTSA
jgi:hypothetical protein